MTGRPACESCRCAPATVRLHVDGAAPFDVCDRCAPSCLGVTGSHAGFARHYARGEQPCRACRQGERLYQRDRARARRRRLAAV